jgi:ankyrin repeat protein
VGEHELVTAEAEKLKRAIDANDFAAVREMMTRWPELHRAELGYGGDGPLTWVAECRVPRERPGETRLAMARWMLENGSDVHQGGDGPLMRAALDGERVPMMELLVAHGADVNAWWHGNFPIVFAACEALAGESLAWLLEHGADPNCEGHGFAVGGHEYPGTALDYLIAGYVRDLPRMRTCLELLLAAGGRTRFGHPAVMAILRGRREELRALLAARPGLVHERFAELDCGQTGGRSLLLRGATLLHVAAEFGCLEEASILVEQGAEVNARATVDAAGVGGQTAIFHAASQFGDSGEAMIRLLRERGADLTVRARIPGDYEKPGELVEGTVLDYARRFGGGSLALLETGG